MEVYNSDGDSVDFNEVAGIGFSIFPERIKNPKKYTTIVTDQSEDDLAYDDYIYFSHIFNKSSFIFEEAGAKDEAEQAYRRYYAFIELDGVPTTEIMVELEKLKIFLQENNVNFIDPNSWMLNDYFHADLLEH